MDEQDKKAERMIKLTILLCGLFIMLKAGQAVMSRYEKPGQFWLHEAVAHAALWGKKMYLPALTAKEGEKDAGTLLTEQMAVFLGWEAAKDTRVYVEDEYTRQELIEAGRKGALSDIRRENGQAASEKENTEKQEEKSPEKNRQTENEGEENKTPDVPTKETKDKDAETEQEVPLEETENDRILPVYVLAEAEKTMSADELLKKYFIVDPVTEAEKTLFSFEKLARPDLSVLPAAGNNPQILIYHTHSQEGFRDSVKNDTDTTIVGVGTYLSDLLTEKGYRVLHLTDTFDLTGGGIDRNKAYTYARKKLKETLEENPSIQVVLDIHRDGVAESKHLVTSIDGRPTAKIMFFNGLSYKRATGKLDSLSNPYIQENLAFSFQAEYLCDYYYPDFSRCIYLKAYRYNLDLLPRSMLVEVGAQTNTVQEAKNAMIPLADVLHKLLQGA